MIVVFRLDASRVIGSGHLARCRVLADALTRAHAAHCLFIGRDPDGMQRRALAGAPHRLLTLPEPSGTSPRGDLLHSHWLGRAQEEDLRLTCALLDDASVDRVDWLVVDHYGLDERWQHAMRQRAQHVLVIDDLADRRLDADIVLDQNLRDASVTAYAPHVAPGTRLLCGPRYALLRSEFRGLDVSGPRSGVLVAFGGADADDWTTRTVRLLLDDHDFTAPVKAVITSAHAAKDALLELARADARFSVEVDSANIATLMVSARLAIGAGGSMTWERCAAGLPALAWPIADNQRGILAAAARAGVLETLSEDEAAHGERLRARAVALLDDEHRLERMRKTAIELVDGRGVERVVALMVPTGG